MNARLKIGLWSLWLLAIGLGVAARQDASGDRDRVCVHRASGERRAFDASGARRCWRGVLGMRPTAAAAKDLLPPEAQRAHGAAGHSSGLKSGAAVRGKIKLTDELPKELVGRCFVFASAERVASADLPEECCVMLTGWRSEAGLAEAVGKAGTRALATATSEMAARLGVTRDETVVRILSTNEVELEPLR